MFLENREERFADRATGDLEFFFDESVDFEFGVRHENDVQLVIAHSIAGASVYYVVYDCVSFSHLIAPFHRLSECPYRVL